MKRGKLALIYTALTALGTSLILAYLVTEMQVRLFYTNSFALFIIACVALASAYVLGFLRGRQGSDHEKLGDDQEDTDSISTDQ